MSFIAMDPKEAEFFDMFGSPITLDEWVYMFKRDPLTLKTKVNGYYILTTWHGVDMQDPMSILGNRYGYRKWEPNETPLIYRSLVFNPDMQVIESAQYANDDDACEGHAQLADKYEN